MDRDIVEKFCGICNWTYQAWCMHKFLYDENPKVKSLMQSKHNGFFSRLSDITQEYSLHQIAKLHDPAMQRGKTNLTLEYILENGGWTQDIRDQLEAVKVQLDEFGKNLNAARNKVLSHIDLNSVLEDQIHSAFPQGADDEYFENLQEFVNIIHENTVGGIFPFDDLAKADAQLLAMELSIPRIVH